MKVGLFFGTFNPIHVGHLIIANYMAEITDLDQVWFVISPQNPLKKKKHILDEHARLELINLAIEGNDQLRVSDVEFDMSRPSYSIDTLGKLSELHPDHEFVLIMGSDNLSQLPEWRDYKKILDQYQVYVYKRQGYKNHPLLKDPNVKSFNVLLLQISSSYIRRALKEGRTVKFFLPDRVYEHIQKKGHYKN